jgi:hypothetical protein
LSSGGMSRSVGTRRSWPCLPFLDDVIVIKAVSIRPLIAPEGSIEVEGGGTSGETLSQAAMTAAAERATEKAKGKTNKKFSDLLAPVLPNEPPKDRTIGAASTYGSKLLRRAERGGGSIPKRAFSPHLTRRCNRCSPLPGHG